jgi:3-isopropylmalate/(R)-2-methylmalate dehydratase small subunit
LEAVRSDFSQSVDQGDVILANANMGVGSSREQAAEVLKYLGIAAVIAPSFAGIFYRNAINLGLPVFTIDEALMDIPSLVDGAKIRFNFEAAELQILDDSTSISLIPFPDFLKELILDGGLVPHLEKRFQTEGSPN